MASSNNSSQQDSSHVPNTTTSGSMAFTPAPGLSAPDSNAQMAAQQYYFHPPYNYVHFDPRVHASAADQSHSSLPPPPPGTVPHQYAYFQHPSAPFSHLYPSGSQHLPNVVVNVQSPARNKRRAAPREEEEESTDDDTSIPSARKRTCKMKQTKAATAPKAVKPRATRRKKDSIVPVPSIGAPCGVGPSTQPSPSMTGIELQGQASAAATESPETVASQPSTSSLSVSSQPLSSLPSPTLGPALSVSPLEFHSSNFSKSSSTSDERASDVWPCYFAGARSERDPEPDEKPGNLSNVPLLKCRPPVTTSPRVGCRLCWEEGRWKTYKNGDGCVTSMRAHLMNKHRSIYEAKLAAMQSERDRREGKKQAMSTQVPFTTEGFLERLMRFAVVDDQALSITENPEFRDLLAYVGQGVGLEPEHIPDGEAMLKTVIEGYKREYGELIREIQTLMGRVSFTSDLWSDLNLRSFMAVTAHWVAQRKDGSLEWKSALLAFRHVEGEHTGEHLANVMFEILKQANLLYKVGQITLDNASNCATMMEHLEYLFRQFDASIPFHRDGNRVRCFPHVINLAVGAILDALSDSKDHNLPSTLEFFDTYLAEHPPDDDAQQFWSLYRNALQGSVMSKARRLVSIFRASGQRREGLRRHIQSGNLSKSWPQVMFYEAMHGVDLSEEKRTGGQLPVVQLLRDCETRWSAGHLMNVRLLTLYPALQSYAAVCDNSTLTSALLTKHDRHVLCDIFLILRIPHAAQELLSSEHTPVLSHALPAYEMVIDAWESLQEDLPHLAHAIRAGVAKLREYISYARRTRVYALAMILNPEVKLAWTNEHWSSDDALRAREWMIEAMLSYRRHRRITERQVRARSLPLGSVNTEQHASRALASGLQGLRTLGKNSLISRATSSSILSDNHASPSSSNNHATDERNDRHIVEAELKCYEEEGPTVFSQNETILSYWSINRQIYPNIFSVAMDILPVQASAVPCERIFSSSKETITPRRSRLSGITVEMLQVLKYRFRRERLDFTCGLLAREEDYALDSPLTATAIDELIQHGRSNEIKEIYESQRDTNIE